MQQDLPRAAKKFREDFAKRNSDIENTNSAKQNNKKVSNNEQLMFMVM